MVKIAPSILSADFANLERDIHRIADADYVHVDVMDGVFVPNISIGIPVVQSIRKVTELPLDVHLMIDKPVRYIEDFAKAGADLLSVHLEADHPTRIAEALKVMGECGVKKAVALRPITSANAILPYIEELDMVLVMTVEPGFGGQAFMESQLDTIRQVRAIIDRYNPACELEVDGGVAPKTAPLVVEAGANVLVAGSAVYGKEDIPAAIAALPLNDLDASLKEIDRAIRDLRLRGIQMYSDVNGMPLDAEALYPIYEKMERYNLPILIHPKRSPALPDYPCAGKFSGAVRQAARRGRQISPAPGLLCPVHAG